METRKDENTEILFYQWECGICDMRTTSFLTLGDARASAAKHHRDTHPNTLDAQSISGLIDPGRHPRELTEARAAFRKQIREYAVLRRQTR